jgi:3-oxoacyl-(acyl-carrier-protein) synthase
LVVNKNIYITGLGSVSPQKTFENGHFLEEVVPVEATHLKCLDPNYRDFIPGDMVRRMSRIIKMGVAAAKIALQDAGCGMPDAIITGTGLGCIEDTEKFLSTLIRNREELLTPTPFIQSTHNTVSAQIALILKCHNYNFTYVHRGFSFESALLDALVRIGSGDSETVLLGGSDELTPNTLAILQRLGQNKRNPVINLELLKDRSRGSLAGEGAAFFVLTGNEQGKKHARIRDVRTWFMPSGAELEKGITEFLQKNGLGIEDISLVITGVNGDPSQDVHYDLLRKDLFPSTAQAWFKHLCGEYHTAVSFALWLAAMILKNGHIPSCVSLNNVQPSGLNHILIHNHYRNINHSVILVSRT